MRPVAAHTPPARLSGEERQRLERACCHALVPDAPAERGFRYLDLGGSLPPLYLRRFQVGERSAAVTLTAPIELSSGRDAERGAPGLARAELSLGPRRVGWDELPDLGLRRGESAILAGAALRTLAALDLLEPADCPLCAEAASSVVPRG